MNKRYIGIVCIVASAFCFAWMGAFVHLSGNLPSIQKSFFRNLIAMFVALLILWRHGNGVHIQKGNLKFLFLRAAFGTVGILCNFYAVDHLVLSDASMLNKMSPFFAILFSYFILKERVTSSQAIAVIGAFVGSLFVIKPTFTNMELIPSLLGMLGGLGAGIAYTMVRILGKRGQDGSVIVLFFSAFSCTVTLPFFILEFQPMSVNQLLCLIGAGIAATGGQFAITAAYYHAPAREISVYDYSQIIFSTCIGWFLFGDLPDGYSILGYVMICAMAVYLFIRQKQLDAAVE